MDFGSSGPKVDSPGGDAPGKDFSKTPQFASPEQLQHGTVDLRSEIYSLGATMYFLLTGVAPRLKMRLQQLRQFPKALRNLLAHMLRANPDRRPQDLVALAEVIRECLVKIERRQAFARRLGIPSAAIIPGKWRMPSTPLAQVMGGIIVVTAVVVAMGVLAMFLLPDDINPFRQRTAERQTIGVPVGVPDASSSPPSQPGNPAPLVANEPATNGEPTIAGANQNGSPTTQQEQTSNSQSVAAAPSPSAANANPSPSAQADNSGQEQAALSAQASVSPQPAGETELDSVAKKQRTAGSTSKSTRNGRSFLDQRDSEPAPTRGRARARVIGITSDGKLIFRLPSGRTAIVAPDSDEDQIAPQRQRRPRIEREEIFSPPSSGLDNFPND
jgi:hypothetical protein